MSSRTKWVDAEFRAFWKMMLWDKTYLWAQPTAKVLKLLSRPLWFYADSESAVIDDGFAFKHR